MKFWWKRIYQIARSGEDVEYIASCCASNHKKAKDAMDLAIKIKRDYSGDNISWLHKQNMISRNIKVF